MTGGGLGAARPTECYKRCGTAGRCGERIERRRWRMKRDERVAAVKILSVRRKAAQKFWAPQQDHRPLRKRNKKFGKRAVGDAGPYGILCRGGRPCPPGAR